MIRSMTGFGKALLALPGKKISIEVRCLNSKQLDLSIKMPSWLSEKESELRTLIAQRLERGKVTLQILLERDASTENRLIDKNLALAYYREIKSLAEAAEDPIQEILPLVLRMPEITKSGEDPILDEEWSVVLHAVEQALEETNSFRSKEGSLLAKDLKLRVNNICELSSRVVNFETTRIDRLRERIRQELLSSFQENEYDPGRFEQEMIYYLERLDITEEKVRLKSHCDFFLQTMGENSPGRKLGFITQEMGREINTLGSKANDLDIQKLVVAMKDDLEKIKEQLLNIL